MTLRNEIVFITIATRKYVTLGVESLESVHSRFQAPGDVQVRLFLLTDQVDEDDGDGAAGVPLPDYVQARRIPDRPWPRSTLAKFEDLIVRVGGEIRGARYAYFLDADTRMVDNVTLDEIQGRLVAVEHPYYPRNHPGFCGRYGDLASTGMNGFDAKGTFTFCQYPYERSRASAAYIDQSRGKLPPRWDTANSYYLQAAFFGGEGPAMYAMLVELRRSVERDNRRRVVASIHDESHLNRYLLDRQDVRVLSSAFIYPEHPKDIQFHMNWLFPLTPKIFHVVKDEAKLRG